jgi:hypothetical protein
METSRNAYFYLNVNRIVKIKRVEGGHCLQHEWCMGMEVGYYVLLSKCYCSKAPKATMQLYKQSWRPLANKATPTLAVQV